MAIKFHNLYLVVALVFSTISCGEGAGEVTKEETEFQVEEDKSESQKVVYYATPSLVEVASIMKTSGATFSSDLLNPDVNSTKYSTHFQKAVNLGVYGADLTYSAMFDESQNSITYLKTIKTMAEDIGLTGAFEKGFLDNIEKNIANRDALLDIITDFYWSTDAYLADNDRSEVSSLIVTGGWIESMYIACDMANRSPKNQEIKKRIAEQKLILKNLILFLESSASEDSNVYECIIEMKDLAAIYETIEVKQGTGNTVTNAKKSETVIGNETTVEISQEQLGKLCMKFSEIRNRFTKI